MTNRQEKIELLPPQSEGTAAGFAFVTLTLFVLCPAVVFNLIWLLPSSLALPMDGWALLVLIDVILLPLGYITVRKAWDRFKYSGGTIELDREHHMVQIRSPWWNPGGRFKHQINKIEHHAAQENRRSQQIAIRAGRYWIVIKPSWSNFSILYDWASTFLRDHGQ